MAQDKVEKQQQTKGVQAKHGDGGVRQTPRQAPPDLPMSAPQTQVGQARLAKVMQRQVGNGRTAQHLNQNPIQRRANKTGLPDRLKSGVESLSGYSMDDVKVHYNSPKPAQLQAHAYAQGTTIHVASGQEKHLPHEAWHVVQQKQGRVQPTIQAKGIAINNDNVLERESDMMGVKALQMQRAKKHPVKMSTPTPKNNYEVNQRKETESTKIVHAPSRNNIIQMDVGFEFEMNWLVQKQKQRTSNWLGRIGLGPVFKDLHRRETFYIDPAGGFELQADSTPNGSDIEAVTNHFPDTPAGLANLDVALLALQNLAGLLDAQNANPHFDWAAPLPMPGLQKNVRIFPQPVGGGLTAAPQATVGIRMDQIHNMLRESANNVPVGVNPATSTTLMGTGDDALIRLATNRANSPQADVPLGGGGANVPPSLELKGLLSLIISYIYKGHASYMPGVQNHLTYSKLIAPFMARTDFVEMFNHLPPAEHVHFSPGGGAGPAGFAAYVIGVINNPAINGATNVFRYGYGNGNGGVVNHALTRDAWLQGIANGIDHMSTHNDPALSDSLGSRGNAGMAGLPAPAVDADAGGIAAAGLGPAVDGMIVEMRRMNNLPYLQWRPVANRIAAFIMALNNNTAIPANVVPF